MPGHAWTDAFGINDDGIVSGWSRKLPNDDGAENPVLWTRSGKVVPLKTAPGQADGIAEATNDSGMTVGYLGNQSKTEPEMDQFAVWRTRAAAPQLMGPLRPNLIAEFVDLNDRGQAIGMTGTQNPRTGFISPARAVIWRTGWTDVRPLAVPAASRRANPFVVPALNDINARGAIVGNVYGLAGETYSDTASHRSGRVGVRLRLVTQMSAIASTSTATPGLCGTRPASSSASSRLAHSTT